MEKEKRFAAVFKNVGWGYEQRNVRNIQKKVMVTDTFMRIILYSFNTNFMAFLP